MACAIFSALPLRLNSFQPYGSRLDQFSQCREKAARQVRGTTCFSLGVSFPACFSLRFQLAQRCHLHIQRGVSSRFQLGCYTEVAHGQQAQHRQGNAYRYVPPPITANRKDCPAIIALGCAEEAHAKDTADERGGQEKRTQNLDDAQRSAVLMGSTGDLGGFGCHFEVHLRGSVSEMLPSMDGCSQTSASRWLTIAKPSLTPIFDLSI